MSAWDYLGADQTNYMCLLPYITIDTNKMFTTKITSVWLLITMAEYVIPKCTLASKPCTTNITYITYE